MSTHRPAHARLFYRDEYVYEALEEGLRHTFDVERPRRVRDALVAAGLAAPSDFIAAPALSDAQLALVHTPGYIAAIKDPGTLARYLLLDPARSWDQRLLQSLLFASGGTVAAARMALAERTIAVNFGGGFHHAQADKAEGFCAIADVAIALRQLRSDELAQPVRRERKRRSDGLAQPARRERKRRGDGLAQPARRERKRRGDGLAQPAQLSWSAAAGRRRRRG